MKIIFLDIDGVLTSARTGWMNWDIYATTFLKWACEQSGSKIVISSTWRCNRDRKFFADIFGDEIIHEDWKTPWNLMDLKMNCRGDEIQAWLNNHPEIPILPEGYPDVVSYIIIDDDADMLPSQMANLIKTDSMNGIVFENMEEIREELSIEIPFNLNTVNLIQHPNMFCETNVGMKLNQKIKQPKFT